MAMNRTYSTTLPLFLILSLAISFIVMAQSTQIQDVCAQIATALSAPSAVHYAGTESFKKFSEHWASSSNQVPACAVQPHTADDVGKILQIIDRTRTPFAVMGGGHATSPFLSSTEGVHISTSAFTSIEYNEVTKTVKFGAGLKWEELYAALEPYGVNVPGGRIPGVGVGGFILGGGYSLHTNQVGLSFDSIVAFELVKPTGEVVEVTHESDPELFFALKGGGNNFGVVTKFTMKTFPQGQIWGGTITYADPAVFGAVNAATAKFSAESTDPKAVLLAYTTFFQGTPLLQAQFLNISSVASTVATQSFTAMINAITISPRPGWSAVCPSIPCAHSLGVSVPAYSLSFMTVLTEQLLSVGPELSDKSLIFLGFVSEPFIPSILSHNTHDTAYPFTRDVLYTPFNIFVAWADPSQDKAMKAAIEKISEVLEKTLVEEGYKDVPTSPLYPNYALWDAPLERIYGTNLPKLQEVKRRVDPGDVMGLAGGFKVPSKAVVRDEL
ncbi:FAD-binding domain-containing protein [Coprinellus micaceus]|uniref:FAD-binding domain-containing protein n=1 Tax=Coprinellus micaceus TaxID=71717 RepID=A0A4Y7SD17_COPMI|nr:FAD-binding domain-containing protein [Coprinellus micaceus]